MITRSSEYRINNAIFAVQYGDITQCSADVIVSSDDNYLSMGGGVSYAISRAAGAALIAEARKQLPLKLGDVAVTSSGSLPSKYVFHAVTIDHDTQAYADAEVISATTRRCLELAATLRAKSIVFPALGTGVARFPFKRCAEAMVSAIAETLGKIGLERVTITLYQRGRIDNEDLNLFYEQAIALAAVASGKKGLHQNLEELSGYIAARGGRELQRRFREFRELLLTDSPETVARVGDLYEETSDLARDAKNLARETDWDTQELERKLLQTKYAGCMAQLNIKVSNLNGLEIEKAKHGGVNVPPRLDFAITELRDDIQRLELEAHQLRAELGAAR
jgi:O-acetyl-ADP-ribose deacetylase (regulator of RNase III)